MFKIEDSVSGDMPVCIKPKGSKHIIVKRIDSISTTPWKTLRTTDPENPGKFIFKQFAECSAAVWTASGWSHIKKVIRHKTSKQMYRIITEKGVVVVTEDHCLFLKNGELITPGELKVNDNIFHRNVNES